MITTLHHPIFTHPTPLSDVITTSLTAVFTTVSPLVPQAIFVATVVGLPSVAIILWWFL